MRLYFFLEDIAMLEQMIKNLHEKIKELGKEQGEVARQSTENFGHDDACQEAIYQERNIITTRLNNLQEIFRNAIVVRPEGCSDTVRMGTIVELSDGCTFQIGSFMVFANYPITNISYNSPLGKVLIGKQEGDKVEFHKQIFTIKHLR